jgi:hypothetical protein
MSDRVQLESLATGAAGEGINKSAAHPVSLCTGSNVKNVKWKVLTVGVQPW